MVRTYKRRSNRGIYGEDGLKAALQSLREGKPLIRTSKEFGIPPRTLRRHRDNMVQRPGSLLMGRYRNALPDNVEQELVTHITEMENKMYGLNVKDVQKLTFDLAEKMNIQHPSTEPAKWPVRTGYSDSWPDTI